MEDALNILIQNETSIIICFEKWLDTGQQFNLQT